MVAAEGLVQSGVFDTEHYLASCGHEIMAVKRPSAYFVHRLHVLRQLSKKQSRRQHGRGKA